MRIMCRFIDSLECEHWRDSHVNFQQIIKNFIKSPIHFFDDTIDDLFFVYNFLVTMTNYFLNRSNHQFTTDKIMSGSSRFQLNFQRPS